MDEWDWSVRSAEAKEEWEFLFLSSFTDLKSTLWTFQTIHFWNGQYFKSHRSYAYYFFTLVFVIVYDSYVMLLYVLLLLLDKVPKYMSDTKPL